MVTSRIRLSIIERLFCMMVLWASGTLLTTDYPIALYGIIIVFAIMVAKGEITMTKTQGRILGGVFVFMVLSIVQNLIYSNGDGFDVVIKNYLIILCVFLFANSKLEHNTERIAFLVRLIVFFSIISSCLYIAYLMGAGLPMSYSKITESNHFFYLFCTGNNNLGIGLMYRNAGIFWEPGMYQVYLTFAILYYLYSQNVRFRYLMIVYLTLVTITTFSVSAYAVMSLIFGFYVLRNNSSFILKIIIALVVLVAAYYAYPFIKESMELKQETGSYMARSNDLSFGYKVFLNHPILGCGIVNNEYAKASSALLGVERPDSNGMINLLINLGLVGFCLVATFFISFVKWARNNISAFIVLGLISWFVLSINTEPIVFHPFCEFIIGIGISYLLSKKQQRTVTICTSE